MSCGWTETRSSASRAVQWSLIETLRHVRGVEASILDRGSDTVRGRLHVRADVVVVAAGAIHTPLLLRANGIGRRSGQLGRNLRLHPALGVSAQFDEETAEGWVIKFGKGLPVVLRTSNHHTVDQDARYLDLPCI